MLDLTPPRRLPGIRFEAVAPQAPGALPRMDVAVLAGFAREGPVGLPVAVEDAREYARIFGAEDAPLAWDPARGQVARAHLGAAVRLFFANGGRRCHALRLARDAVTNRFAIPGLLALCEAAPLAQAVLPAVSPGSWSDAVAVAASLDARRLAVLDFMPATHRLRLRLPPGERLAGGELLRLAWDAPAALLHLRAASVTEAGGEVLVEGNRAEWLEPVATASPSAILAGAGVVSAIPGRVLEAVVSATGTRDDGLIQLDLGPAPGSPAPALAMPRPGELLLLSQASEAGPLLFVVREAALGPRGVPRLAGESFRHLPGPPPGDLSRPARAERLRLRLWARREGQLVPPLEELGLTPGHARHLGRLPIDAETYAGTAPDPAWADARAARFPLAGEVPGAVFLPLGLPVLPPSPETYLGPLPRAEDALTRDGLAEFTPDLFADLALAGSPATTLLAEAEALRSLLPSGHGRLRGLHAALPVEEASLIAVPDAVQRGWRRVPAPPAPPPPNQPSQPVPREAPFGPCAAPLPAPVLRLDPLPDSAGRFGLAWDGPLPAETSIAIEEARSPHWTDAAPVPEPMQGLAVALRRPGPGACYYRARLLRGAEQGPWSAGLIVEIPGAAAWEVLPLREYRDATLVAVHRLLLRLAGARGDMVAVLSLPGHLREAEALAYAGRLRRPPRPGDAAVPEPEGGLFIPPLTGGEAGCLGYAALYHPWVVAAEEEGFAALPPDGAVCGLVARRALSRGAWVAPANEALRGVVALDPRIPPERRQAMLEAQLNLLRQEPTGFTVLAADTLSNDPETRPLNVRRLLILLRRLALREGQAWAFEPNDAALRRAVQRGFEAWLGELYARGAFAGASAAEGFRVVTESGTAAALSEDRGRLLVELRVAPSLPLAFLLLRLVQRGERLAVEEG
jgi:hypothetical protein